MAHEHLLRYQKRIYRCPGNIGKPARSNNLNSLCILKSCILPGRNDPGQSNCRQNNGENDHKGMGHLKWFFHSYVLSSLLQLSENGALPRIGKNNILPVQPLHLQASAAESLPDHHFDVGLFPLKPWEHRRNQPGFPAKLNADPQSLSFPLQSQKVPRQTLPSGPAFFSPFPRTVLPLRSGQTFFQHAQTGGFPDFFPDC